MRERTKYLYVHKILQRMKKDKERTIQTFVFVNSHKLVKSYADLMEIDLPEAYDQLLNAGFGVLCKNFAETARATMASQQKNMP